MANESRIELRGISNLVSFLTVKGSCLLPDIKQNDKTPSWDGFIEVYQNDKHSKEGLRKIPTQVKSTTSTNIKDNEVKKSFSRIDLENYFHDGGILIFFIVDVDNESKIFFRFFQKVDLNNILVSMRNKQKEKTLSFQKLDSDIKKFEISCRNFLLHKKNQFSFDVFNTKPDNIELVIQEISQGTYEFLNSLYESAKNIYWRSSPETKIPDNVFKGIIKPTINELKNELIQIGDSEFTYNVKILTYVNKIEIYFGNSIHITYPKINIKIDDDCQDNENEANILPKPSISYQLTNKIDEIKKDLEFLTSFFKHQKIVLRNSTLLQVKNHDKTFDETYKALKEDLIRLNQIITLLDIFHIKHEKLLLNKIKSENDFRNLHFLINHIVLKKSLTSEKASPKLKYQICFGGINLLVTIDGGNNVYKVMNFCDIDTLKISTVDKPSESYICSQYVFLTHQEIIDNDNINLDIMVKSIKSFEKMKNISLE